MMRRIASFAPLVPIALLTGGCVEEAYTPSELLPERALPTQEITTEIPARENVAARWQLPTTSPWSPYEKLTLLSVLGASPAPATLPNVHAMDDVNRAAIAATCVARAGMPNNTMWIVDLPGAASVAFGATLSRESSTSVATVPTFNNWPADDELVPAEEALAGLVMMAPKLPSPTDVSARPVFMLDSWRLAYKDETVEEEVTDNRYMLTSGDFPTADVLQTNGIHRIIYVINGGADDTREEDDLNELFVAYRAAGIEIAIVDLDWLTQVPEPDVIWGVALRPRLLFVEPRMTIIHDERFYLRARGGFGGVHGVPAGGWSHFGGGHGGGGRGLGGHGGG